MDERGANIDIIFRNGLRDYEVLPPADVWDNINPVIRKKARSFTFLRVAAASAVMLMMGFLAYWFSRNLSADLDNVVTALNENTLNSESRNESPLYIVSRDYDQVSPDFNQGLIAKDISSEQSSVENVIQDENSAAPGSAYLPETNDLSMFVAKSSEKNMVTAFKPSEKFSLGNSKTPELFPIETPVSNKGKRWSIAALASPTYNSRIGSVNDDFARQLTESESQGSSYAGGVLFSYKVNRRFSVQSGLIYSSVGKEVEGISSFGGFQKYVNSKGGHNFEVLTTNGSILTSNQDVFLTSTSPVARIVTNYTNDFFDPEKASLEYLGNTLDQNFSYLELPINLRYKFVDKTLDINLIGGVSYNLLVKNSVYTVIDGGKYPVGVTEGLSPVTISSSLGMGLEYNISESFSLNLEPTFRYYLNSSLSSGSQFRPYSFGIFSGLSFKF
jgi:hypothetical protein